MAASSSQATHLLRLSPELRNEIYSYALTTRDEPVWIVDENNKVATPLALLQTCRRIRLEASATYYSNTHFNIWLYKKPFVNTDLSYTKPLLAWFRSVSSRHLELILGLHILARGAFASLWFSATRAAI